MANPHVHCLVAGGGLAPDGTWRAIGNGYLLPYRQVRHVFRQRCCDVLEALLRSGALELPGDLSLAEALRIVARARRRKWNVRLEAPWLRFYLASRPEAQAEPAPPPCHLDRRTRRCLVRSGEISAEAAERASSLRQRAGRGSFAGERRALVEPCGVGARLGFTPAPRALGLPPPTRRRGSDVPCERPPTRSLLQRLVPEPLTGSTFTSSAAATAKSRPLATAVHSA